MGLRRTQRCSIINGGKQYGTNEAGLAIKKAVDNNEIRFKTRILREGERLDIISGQEYQNSIYYWVIASASGIGWALQCPPGTIIVIPNLEDVTKIVG